MFPRLIGMLLAMAAFIPVISFSAIAEERVVDAYSAWDFSGQLVPSSATQSRMVGTFQGIVFVEEQEGLRDAGIISCTADMLLSASESRISGDGSCVFISATGPRMYAKYECKGTIGLGCKGKFHVESGSQKFEGITGQGDFILRAVIVNDLSEYHGSVAENSISGLAIWHDLKVVIPEQSDSGVTQSDQTGSSQ